MPNHFAVQILCRLGDDVEDPDFSSLTDLNLCEAVLPMPQDKRGEVPGLHPPWYTWAMGNWGTKWGTYRTTAARVPGDNFDKWWISFECAWNPPKPEVMRKIFAYLEREHRLSAEMAVFFEPSDSTYWFKPIIAEERQGEW